MQFVIDGNNLLGEMGKDRSLEGIRFIINWLAKSKSGKNIALVFDGLPPSFDLKFNDYPNIKVLFQDPAFDNNADDFIVRLIKNSKNHSEITVVTSDKELIRRVKDIFRNIKVLTSAEYYRTENKEVSSKTKNQIALEESSEKSKALRGLNIEG